MAYVLAFLALAVSVGGGFRVAAMYAFACIFNHGGARVFPAQGSSRQFSVAITTLN
jgi:hypothetical protein